VILVGYIQNNFDFKSFLDAEKLKGKIVNVYLLAKEGISRPRILNSKSKPLLWTRDAIKSLADKVKSGIQAFNGHAETNSTYNRDKIGEVVGSFVQEIGGKLNHYVAIASDRNHPYNVISMESTVEYKDEGEIGIVDRVLDVTAVALGIKGRDIPGIEGTELIAQMQFFEEDKLYRSSKTMNLEEVRRLIRENNWKVSDLFDFKKIVGKIKLEDDQIVYEAEEADPAINNIIEKYVLKQINPVLEERKRKLQQYEPIVQEYKTLKLESEKQRAKNQIDVLVKERSLTDGHKKFLESVFDEYNPEALKFEDFVENKLNIYKKLIDSGLIASEIEAKKPEKPSNSSNATKSFEDILEEIQ